jgi:peptidyl-tRNA hydrolase, PTH1 family
MERTEMYVVTCLGNPGKKYIRNRHNVGFILGEFIIQKYQVSISSSSFLALSGKVVIGMTEFLLLLPQGYMNRSGVSVRKAMEFYSVEPDHLVAIHDDIELPFGLCKKKFGGGHKGHNGIRSIIQEIGTPDFHRIRIGVGRPVDQETAVADHVLSNFAREELIKIQELAPAAEEMLISIIGPDAG